jgi:hypothetical protein
MWPLNLIPSAFGLKGILASAAIAFAAGSIGGWQVRDAFCDAAKAKEDLAAEQRAHANTKLDLTAAQRGAQNANTIAGWLEGWSAKREEIVREAPPVAPSNADCRRLGADGLKWLRRIGPD